MHQVWCICEASKVAAVVFLTAKLSQRRRCAEIDAPLVKINKIYELECDLSHSY